MFKIKIKVVNTFDGGVALIHKRWRFIFYICKVFRLYCTSGFQTPEQSTCALIFETIESRENYFYFERQTTIRVETMYSGRTR